MRKTHKFLALMLTLIMATLVGCTAAPAPEAPAQQAPQPAQPAAEGAASPQTGSTPEMEPATVVYAVAADQVNAVNQLVAEFNKTYPNITVEIMELPGNTDERKQAVMTSFAAGDSDPDVMEADIIWTAQFAAANWLMDVTDYIEKDEYLEGSLSTCTVGDRIYAFPINTDVGLLYYRKDLIETAPKTWDELLAMCNENMGKNGIEYGLVWQGYQAEAVVCNGLEFMKCNGGNDIVNGEVLINSAENIEALDFMKSLIADGISPESVLSAKNDDSLSLFKSGKTLFMRNWTYAYNNSQTDDSLVKDMVGVAPVPVGFNGTESSGTVGGSNYIINAATDVPDAALALVSWLSGEEGQKMRATISNYFPTRKALYDDAELLAAWPLLEDLAPAFATAKARPQVVDYPAVSSVLQNYIHQALSGTMTSADAMAKAEEELKQVISS